MKIGTLAFLYPYYLMTQAFIVGREFLRKVTATVRMPSTALLIGVGFNDNLPQIIDLGIPLNPRPFTCRIYLVRCSERLKFSTRP